MCRVPLTATVCFAQAQGYTICFHLFYVLLFSAVCLSLVCVGDRNKSANYLFVLSAVVDSTVAVSHIDSEIEKIKKKKIDILREPVSVQHGESR